MRLGGVGDGEFGFGVGVGGGTGVGGVIMLEKAVVKTLLVAGAALPLLSLLLIR